MSIDFGSVLVALDGYTYYKQNYLVTSKGLDYYYIRWFLQPLGTKIITSNIVWTNTYLHNNIYLSI